MSQKILVIDDEYLIRWTLEQHLVKEGYDVATADSAEKGLELIAEDQPDLVLLDNRLSEMTGLELLERLKPRERGLMVIMLTAYGMVDAAVKAMKLGAYDYISKPFNLDEITFVINKALEAGCLRSQVRQLRQECSSGVDSIIGECSEMVTIRSLILGIAKSDATAVLIQGESGTGKELVARTVHYSSARADKPFMEINCAALPGTLLERELIGHEKGAFTDAGTSKKGLFELADGGTVFLDEIGDMHMGMQGKLLSLLEDKTFKRIGGVKDIGVDVRVVSATSQKLAKAVNDGRFRKDLFYRLQAAPVHLPPLRKRGHDILLLASHFIGYFNNECHKNVRGMSKEAEPVLLSYPWPGNVRELKNVVERAMILEVENELQPEHLSHEIREGPHHEPMKMSIPASLEGLVIPEEGLSLEDVENTLIRKALEMANHDQRKAAWMLKMPHDALRRRMKRFGII